MKWLDWILELIKSLLAYLSVEYKKSNNPNAADITQFLGDKALELGGLKGALANLGIEFGAATITEAVDFVDTHKLTLLGMTKAELSFIFGKMFKNKGKFGKRDYADLMASLETEMLVLEASANADALQGLSESVQRKKALAKDLKRKMSILARFALVKAISIATGGII